jgi:hypothetical protein
MHYKWGISKYQRTVGKFIDSQHLLIQLTFFNECDYKLVEFGFANAI